MKVKKEREYNIDLLRIVACIMIIALHETGYVYTYNVKWSAMQSIIRPFLWIFCAISGYYLLNNKDDIKTFYKKRLKTIIIPFIIYSLLLAVLNNLITGVTFYNGINKQFFINLWTGAYSGHLWFVYSILGLYLITPFIKLMINKLNNKEILALLGIMFFFLSINPILGYYGYSTSIDIPMQSVMLFYFILGYYISKIKLDKKSFIALCVVGIFNIVFLSFFANKIACIQSGLYNCSINMVIGVLFTFELFKRIKINKILNKPISYISGRTYPIYIIHLFILQQVATRINIPYTQQNILYMVPIRVLLIFVISLVITSIMYVINKIIKNLISKKDK